MMANPVHRAELLFSSNIKSRSAGENSEERDRAGLRALVLAITAVEGGGLRVGGVRPGDFGGKSLEMAHHTGRDAFTKQRPCRFAQC